MIDVGAKSVPSFLRLSGVLMRVMSASIGLIQGVVSGFLIPLLAHKLHDKDLKFRSLRSAALTSVASMLSTLLSCTESRDSESSIVRLRSIKP